MRKLLHDQSLTIVTLATLSALSRRASSDGAPGHTTRDQQEHQEPTVSFGAYLRSGHFVEATFENWESEFLQMGAYVLLTAFLVQRGSAGIARSGRATGSRKKHEPLDGRFTLGSQTIRGGPLGIRELARRLRLFAILPLSFRRACLGRRQGV